MEHYSVRMGHISAQGPPIWRISFSKQDNDLKQRRPFQKILMVIAFISYFSAIFCGGAAFYFGEGSQDPIAASLMASVVFFVGVGIVLQVIGSSNLPNLKFEK